MYLYGSGFKKITQLRKDTQGHITFELFDSGTVRKGSGVYNYTTRNSTCKIAPRGSKNSRQKITMYYKIQITPQMLTCFGLYIGDGFKSVGPKRHGMISLSQNEPHITKFARQNFLQLFGDSITFTHKVNEDGLFFMSDEMRKAIEDMRSFMLASGRKVSTRDEHEKYLVSDLEKAFAEQTDRLKIAIKKYRDKRLFELNKGYLLEFFSNRPFMNEYMYNMKVKELRDAGEPQSYIHTKG